MAWSGTLAAPIIADDESIIVNPAYNPSRWGRLLIIDAAGDASIVAVRGATDGGRSWRHKANWTLTPQPRMASPLTEA